MKGAWLAAAVLLLSGTGAALAQQHETESLEELRRAAAQGPLEPGRALRLAEAEASAGNAARARRLLRATATRYRSVRAWLRLARLQSDGQDAAGALASLGKARELAPGSEEVLAAYAEAALATKDPLTALPALETLTRLCPSESRYHHLHGIALLAAGDAAAALEPLRAAERLASDQPAVLITLAAPLNDRQLFAEAKPLLLRALSLQPENIEALVELARAEEGLGEHAEAEAVARRVLALSPGKPAASLVLGRIALEAQRYADARDALLQALEADPTLPGVHYQLSLAYARLGDTPNAESHLTLHNRQTERAAERLAKVRALTGFSEGGMQH